MKMAYLYYKWFVCSGIERNLTRLCMINMF